MLEPLRQFWEESFGDVLPIIMEDNAPAYKKVCIPVREALRMMTLDWPPNYPDLNPIEHIWGYMKDIIVEDYARISSAEEMKRIVQQMLDEFKDNQWDKLIGNMPERTQAVIVAHGGSTGY